MRPYLLYKCRRSPKKFNENIFTVFYFRCKNIEADWVNCDNVPKFFQIAVNDSFNFALLSTKWWARYDDRLNYKKEYAVVGVDWKKLKMELHRQDLSHLKHRIRDDIDSIYFKHVPLNFNYSHSEIFFPESWNKTERREFRLALSRSKVFCLTPNCELRSLKRYYELVRVFFGAGIFWFFPRS